MYSKGCLMLHTFRNVLNNDTLWVNLLHDIQKKFRYQTLTANDLVAFINARTGTDYSYLFDQYLRYTDIPVLNVTLTPKGADLQVNYRWQANVNNFRMPIKVTTGPGHMDFIYPVQHWKTLVLKNMPMEEFDVDTQNFYIQLKIE
jgi:aminopeptidase N